MTIILFIFFKYLFILFIFCHLQNSDQRVAESEAPEKDDNFVTEILMQNHDVLLSTFRSRLTKLQVTC